MAVHNSFITSSKRMNNNKKQKVGATSNSHVFATRQRGRLLTLLPDRELSDTMAANKERNGAPLFVTIC